MAHVIDRAQTGAVADKLRSQGKKVVTMNGSFDILHVGHIRCLEEAKQQGDALIVAANSDASIKGYKGEGRPIVPEGERIEMLAALSCVDYVVLFDEASPKAIISEIRPDVHCNGADWGPGCIERQVVEDNGGRLHILSWSPGRSTSELLERIHSTETAPGAVFIRRSLLKAGSETALAKGALSGLKLVLFANADDANVSLGKITPDRECECSPPDTAMLQQARDELGLALGSSWVVSDDMRHIVMGREENAKTILVGKAPAGYLQPHAEAEDLAAALLVITGR